MTISTFNYPGGKTTLSNWIVEYIPAHNQYVEPFGGSGAVMANKPESPLEVYNDTASLCVDFFRAVKHKPDELQHWVQTTPYSRELFNEYTEKLQQNPPENLVERAGMFWYVQANSFGGKGVANSKNPYLGVVHTEQSYGDEAKKLKSISDNFHKVLERFRQVQIENLDFESVFEKYDSPETAFYCDPPYVNVGDDYYQTEDGGFDHSRFVETVCDIDGKWLISYDQNIPERLERFETVRRTKTASMSAAKPEKVETLTINYDPNDTPMFREQEQQGLEAYE